MTTVGVRTSEEFGRQMQSIGQSCLSPTEIFGNLRRVIHSSLEGQLNCSTFPMDSTNHFLTSFFVGDYARDSERGKWGEGKSPRARPRAIVTRSEKRRSNASQYEAPNGDGLVLLAKVTHWNFKYLCLFYTGPVCLRFAFMCLAKWFPETKQNCSLNCFRFLSCEIRDSRVK